MRWFGEVFCEETFGRSLQCQLFVTVRGETVTPFFNMGKDRSLHQHVNKVWLLSYYLQERKKKKDRPVRRVSWTLADFLSHLCNSVKPVPTVLMVHCNTESVQITPPSEFHLLQAAKYSEFPVSKRLSLTSHYIIFLPCSPFLYLPPVTSLSCPFMPLSPAI